MSVINRTRWLWLCDRMLWTGDQVSIVQSENKCVWLFWTCDFVICAVWNMLLRKENLKCDVEYNSQDY